MSFTVGIAIAVGCAILLVIALILKKNQQK